MTINGELVKGLAYWHRWQVVDPWLFFHRGRVYRHGGGFSVRFLTKIRWGSVVGFCCILVEVCPLCLCHGSLCPSLLLMRTLVKECCFAGEVYICHR